MTRSAFRPALRALATAFAALIVVLPAQAQSSGAYHIWATPEYKMRMGLPEFPAATTMEYFGGSVFSSAKVVSVIWGSGVNPATVAGIPGFTAAVVNSTFVDQLEQYGTHRPGVNGHPGTRQSIERGSFLGQIQIAPHNKSTSLLDADVREELKDQIAAGVLPPHDTSTLYMVYFPPTVTITLDGLVSCRDFGAYHFATIDTALKRSNIFYSIEPDCGYDFATITFAASHEYAEATTDNIPTPGTNPAFPQAWNTAGGYEIGDLCGGSGTLTSATGTYTVTQVFLNSTGACSTGNYTSP